MSLMIDDPRDGEVVPIRIVVRRAKVDVVYRAAVKAAGGLTLAIMILVFVFLVVRSERIIRIESLSKFLSTQVWEPDQARSGVGSVLFGTVLIALIAVVLAFPFSVGTALFITEYAPRRLRGVLTTLVDLLAAIPSVIFGAWGVFFLEPRERHLSIWMAHHLGFIPLFKVGDGEFANSPFIAGTVLALMIIPISAAVMLAVFSQAPVVEREGALALGGTRWGMITTVVLPFGRGGIVGGTMLGLGRALGETIAVTLLISPVYTRSTEILHQGTNTIAALIALQFGEASPIGISALMAAGLVLFVVTLLVNVVASIVTSRSRSGAGTDL